MRESVAIFGPWLLSAITIWQALLAGNKHKHAWSLGLLNQVLWFVWIISIQSWGLLPMNFALTFVFARNHYRWRAENAAPYKA